MEGLKIVIEVVWKMGWLWVPPALVLIAYYTQEAAAERKAKKLRRYKELKGMN